MSQGIRAVVLVFLLFAGFCQIARSVEAHKQHASGSGQSPARSAASNSGSFKVLPGGEVEDSHADELTVSEEGSTEERGHDGTVDNESLEAAYEQMHFALLAVSRGDVIEAADHAWASFLNLPSPIPVETSGVAGLAAQVLLAADKVREARAIVRASNPCHWADETWLSAAMLASDSGEHELAALLYHMVQLRAGKGAGYNDTRIFGQYIRSLDDKAAPYTAADTGLEYYEPVERAQVQSEGLSQACRDSVYESMKFQGKSCVLSVGRHIAQLLECANRKDRRVLSSLARLFATVDFPANNALHSSTLTSHEESTSRALAVLRGRLEEEWVPLVSMEYLVGLRSLALQAASRSLQLSDRPALRRILLPKHNQSKGIVVASARRLPHEHSTRALSDMFRRARQVAGVASPPRDELMTVAINKISTALDVLARSRTNMQSEYSTNFSRYMEARSRRSGLFDVAVIDPGDAYSFHSSLFRHIGTFSNVTAFKLGLLKPRDAMDLGLTTFHSMGSAEHHSFQSLTISRQLEWALAATYAAEKKWAEAQVHMKQVLAIDAATLGEKHLQYGRDLLALAFMQLQGKGKNDCTTALQTLKTVKDLAIAALGASAAPRSVLHFKANVLSGHAQLCLGYQQRAAATYKRVFESAQGLGMPATWMAEVGSLSALVHENIALESVLDQCSTIKCAADVFRSVDTATASTWSTLASVKSPFRGWVPQATCLAKVLTIAAEEVQPLFARAWAVWDTVPSHRRASNRIFEVFHMRSARHVFFHDMAPGLTMGQGSMAAIQFLALQFALETFPPALMAHAATLRSSFAIESGIDFSGLFGPKSVFDDPNFRPRLEQSRQEIAWPQKAVAPKRALLISNGLHLDEPDTFSQEPAFRMHSAADSHLLLPIEGFQLFRHSQRTLMRFSNLQDASRTIFMLKDGPAALLLRSLRHIAGGMIHLNERIVWAAQSNHSISDWYGMDISEQSLGWSKGTASWTPAGSGRLFGMHMWPSAPPVTCVNSIVTSLMASYFNLNDVLLRMLVLLRAVHNGATTTDVQWVFTDNPNPAYRALIRVVLLAASSSYRMYESLKTLQMKLIALEVVQDVRAVQPTSLLVDAHSLYDLNNLLAVMQATQMGGPALPQGAQ